MADYYEVLGVSREASQADIKKAYKRLVRENHPDVAPDKAQAEKKMGAINEAYGVLSDPDKRSYYDRFGAAPGQNGDMGGSDMGGFGGFPFGDIFDSFFGGGASSRGPRPTRGRDIRVMLEISLSDAFTGVKREVKYSVEEVCLTCQGKLSTEPDGVETCAQCHGTGQVNRQINIGFGTVVQTVTCSACRGVGKNVKKPCPECHGQGIVENEKHLEVSIPAGIDDGTTLRVGGKGEPGQLGGPSGDLLVVVRVNAEGSGFDRDGDDLIAWRKLTFTQAALGADVEMDLIDGTTEQIKVPAGTQTGSKFRLKGKGMPKLGRKGSGDLYVFVAVMVPTKLNNKQKELLKEFAEAGSQEAEEKGGGWFEKLKNAIFGR
ncbi:MAG: molecular chaperone DnaJ [bacterium]|nr:molecular chaperone DnaJ [bacterium]